ncbi:MAG TPA: M81 family metallopeptidase [Thermodesulfobacteriota bacterium]
MRLAVLGLHHETNTFAPTATTCEDFARAGILRGGEVVRAYRDSHATLAGFFDAAERHGADCVPLLYTTTEPSGTITADAFDRIVGEMLDRLASGGPWDGVLLAQHGAAVAEGYPDADGEIAARVREVVGPAVPIGLALDMHANISRRMIENVTATVVYRTNPHLDPRPRAFECAEIIVRTARGEVHPVQALETPPLVVNIVRQCTDEEPMRSLVRDVESVIDRAGLLSASIAEGYPYADVPEMGMSVLAVADGDPEAAREAARWLAGRAWARRAEMTGAIASPEEALRRAAAAPRGPVVLMDVGDNIGGGSPADSTVLLATARRLGVRGLLQTLYDPEAVAACAAAGVGATVRLRVGAKTDDRHGEPVEVEGRVRLLSDGRYEDPTPTHGGARFFDAGPTAVLETLEDHTLVLTSRRVGNTSREQMYALGIRPETRRVVVAKGVVSPRPAYAPIAAEIILVDTPGVTSADLSRFRYERRRRPLYPFEAEAAYPGGGIAR